MSAVVVRGTVLIAYVRTSIQLNRKCYGKSQHESHSNPLPPQEAKTLPEDFASRLGFAGKDRRITVWRWETGKRVPSPQTVLLMRGPATANLKRVGLEPSSALLLPAERQLTGDKHRTAGVSKPEVKR